MGFIFPCVFAGCLRDALFDARGSKRIEVELELLVLASAGELLEHQARLDVEAVWYLLEQHSRTSPTISW